MEIDREKLQEISKYFLDAQKILSSILPKTSRRCVINGKEAVVSLSDSKMITIDFNDKNYVDEYFNKFELK